MDSDKPTVKIGEILLQCGLVTEGELEEALNYAVTRQMRLGEALVELGFIDQNRLGWALSLQFDLSYVDVQTDMVDWELLAGMPLERLGELQMVPLSRVRNTVTAVIADPTMKGLFHVMAELFPHDNVIVQMATEEAIAATLQEARRRRRTASMAAEELEVESGGLEKLFATLESGAAKRILLLREGESDTVKVLHDGKEVGEESAEVLEALAERFGGRESQRLANGFTGLRPGNPGKGVPPIRILQVGALNGTVAGLSIVPTMENEPSPISAPVEIECRNLGFAGAVALRELGAFASETAKLVVAISSGWDFSVPGVVQIETEQAADGFRLVPRVASCFAPDAMLIIEQMPYTLFLGVASTPDRVSVILRSGMRDGEDGNGDDPVALRSRIQEVLRGGNT